MEGLKNCVKQYRDIDNVIRELNKEVYSKRDERKTIEKQLAEFMKLPQLQGIDTLKIDEDGSSIRIHRPETYAKPWSLSKKDLESLVLQYFQDNSDPDPTDLIEFICKSRASALVAREYDFTRVLPKE
uniref:Uncharacterized protein n=1 Tax=viral metagenome TaxID=1070528 RepID=A0A6C0JYE4_9ZZZZ